MMHELWLVLAFLLGALIMKAFVKAADHFIEQMVLSEDAYEKCPLKNDMKTAENTHRKSIPEHMRHLLDKLHNRSKVKDIYDYRGTVVQIGTARQTQVRICHYE